MNRNKHAIRTYCLVRAKLPVEESQPCDRGPCRRAAEQFVIFFQPELGLPDGWIFLALCVPCGDLADRTIGKLGSTDKAPPRLVPSVAPSCAPRALEAPPQPEPVAAVVKGYAGRTVKVAGAW
jgi:hypothetical protein